MTIDFWPLLIIVATPIVASMWMALLCIGAIDKLKRRVEALEARDIPEAPPTERRDSSSIFADMDLDFGERTQPGRRR